MKLMRGSKVSLGNMARRVVQNCLRGVIGADDWLLSIDGAFGEDAWHRLRRGSAAVQLVCLPAGTGKRGVGAGVVTDAYISRDSIPCEMAMV